MIYTADRSKAVAPVLLLHCVALWFNLRGDSYKLLSCVFVLVFFSPFSIATTSHGEEIAGLCAFRAFVSFARVVYVPFLFLFLLVSGIGCDL